MIERICEFITKRIRKEMPEVNDERAEVINYGLQVIIGEIPKTFIIIAIAFLIGMGKLSILSIIAIIPYRTFARRISFKDTYWLHCYDSYNVCRKCVLK